MQTRKIFFTLSFAVAACVIAAELRAQTPNSIKVKEDKLPDRELRRSGAKQRRRERTTQEES